METLDLISYVRIEENLLSELNLQLNLESDIMEMYNDVSEFTVVEDLISFVF